MGSPAECRQIRLGRDAVGAGIDYGAGAFAARSDVLWAGTGDGLLQLTTDGGAKWANVTPPQIKPWTRIFNMEAATSTQDGYAAANSCASTI